MKIKYLFFILIYLFVGKSSHAQLDSLYSIQACLNWKAYLKNNVASITWNIEDKNNYGLPEFKIEGKLVKYHTVKIDTFFDRQYKTILKIDSSNYPVRVDTTELEVISFDSLGRFIEESRHSIRYNHYGNSIKKEEYDFYCRQIIYDSNGKVVFRFSGNSKQAPGIIKPTEDDASQPHGYYSYFTYSNAGDTIKVEKIEHYPHDTLPWKTYVRNITLKRDKKGRITRARLKSGDTSKMLYKFIYNKNGTLKKTIDTEYRNGKKIYKYKLKYIYRNRGTILKKVIVNDHWISRFNNKKAKEKFKLHISYSKNGLPAEEKSYLSSIVKRKEKIHYNYTFNKKN